MPSLKDSINWSAREVGTVAILQTIATLANYETFNLIVLSFLFNTKLCSFESYFV